MAEPSEYSSLLPLHPELQQLMQCIGLTSDTRDHEESNDPVMQDGFTGRRLEAVHQGLQLHKDLLREKPGVLLSKL